jgi:PAS domain S-box-containing protein
MMIGLESEGWPGTETMTQPDGIRLPKEMEPHRLQDRIRELEEEVARLKLSLAESDHRYQAVQQEAADTQYKEVFDHISVCMFLVDVMDDGRFRYVRFNSAEEKAVGLASANVAGRYVEEVFPEDLARKLNDNYRRCLKGGVPIAYDDELILPGGHKYFHSNLIPLRDPSGRVHRIVGACVDITDFRRSQEDALARQKLESLGVLAAGIAHDFNNLLGTILAEAELAEAELASGSAADQPLRSIKVVSTRAGEIVRELMVFAGQDEASFGPVDLARLVEEMLELLKVSIAKHATMEVDLPRHLPPIRANAVQIRQVVMNLITNASEALGENEGMISIGIAKVDGQERNPSLRLTVSDTGMGMTPEVLSRIFDPFFTTKFAGRGLGLAAVQGIIRGHGGSIDVNSLPGQGSRFEILLPCHQQAIEDVRPTLNSQSENDNSTGTVLVVEDEQVLRSAVANMLRKSGFVVIEAGDGIAGARLFQDHAASIDVTLLDMTLPGIPGQEVLQAIRRAQPDARVILTSAYSLDALRTPAGGSAWGFIRKPYRIAELTGLLREACRKRGQEAVV